MNAQYMNTRWKISIDVLDHRLIAGWAWDATAPDHPVMIELTSTNGEKFVCQADVFRKDLLEAGIGNGRHGYEVDIGTWDLIGHTFVVRPVAAGADGVFVSAIFDLIPMLRAKTWYQSYRSLMLPLMTSLQSKTL